MKFERASIALAAALLLSAPFLYLLDRSDIADMLDAPEVIHVGRDFKIKSLQLAVDRAREGATIIVHQGDYYETVSIGKGLTLMGAPGEDCRLMSNEMTRKSGREYMMNITGESEVDVHGLTFNIINDTWDDAAIKVQWGTGHRVHDNTIYGGRQGIWVHGGDSKVNLNVTDISIYNNTLTNVSGHGIYMQRTYGKVYDNRISNSTGDGIMVAFGWTYPTRFGGYITGNIIDNCSVGINFVNSSLYHYFSNTISNCSVGEMFNSSTQHSHDNMFLNCSVGSRVMNGSTPLIRANDYEDCTVPIELNRSSGARIYGNDMNGTTVGVHPIWDAVDQLRHDIGSNNSIDGRPVFYSFGDKGADRTLKDYGQVFIANSTGSKYKMTDPSPAVVTIVGSLDLDLSGSRVETGLEIIGSEGVTAEGLDLEYAGSSHRGMILSGSSMSLYNSSIIAENSEVELQTSDLDMYNVSGSFYYSYDDASKVRRYSFIGLQVLFEDGEEPVEGAEFEFTTAGSLVISTPLFGGVSGPTGPDGRAGPFWLLYGSIVSSKVKFFKTDLTVNVTVDRSFQETRTVNTTDGHEERFVTTDIRRPGAPTNLRTVPISGDGIGLEWKANTDDTVLYKVYRLDGSDWVFVEGSLEARYTDASVPNGTSAEYRVTAIDDVGLESLPSAPAEGTSVDNLPPLPPTSLKVDSSTEHSAVLSWKRSPSLDVVQYEVFIVKTGNGGAVEPLRMTTSTSELTAEITEMPGDGEMVAVRAVDEAGHRSVFCDPIDPLDEDTILPVISEIKWNFGARSASISCKTDVPTRCDLFIGSSREDLRSTGLDALGTDHFFEVGSLQPKTTYYFYITATKPSGTSSTDDNDGSFYSFTTLSSECYLKVVLVDEDNEPVTRAVVRAEGATGTIDVLETEPGTYNAFLTPGNWTVSVVSVDHQPVTPVQFDIEPDQWKNVTLVLVGIGWEKANVTIVVLDLEGMPVAGARVEADGIFAVSGADGKAVLVGLATNRSYIIKVKADGFKPLEQEIFVGTKKREQSETVHMEETGDGGGFPWWVLIIVGVGVLFLLLLVIIVVAASRRKGRKEDEEEEEEEPSKKEEDTPEVKEGVIPGSDKKAASSKKGAKEKPSDKEE